MTLIVFLKLTSELSLYSMLAMFVGALTGVSGTLMMPMLLIVAAGTVSFALYRQGFRKLRWAGMLLLAAAFYLTGNDTDKVILILPSVYVLLQTFRRLGMTTYYQYHDQFRFGLPFLCVAALVMLVLYTWDISGLIVPYMILYLMSGALCLRMLRLTDEMSRNGVLMGYNIASAAAVAAAALLLTGDAAALAAKAVLGFVMRWIVTPVVTVVSYVMAGIMTGLWWVVSKIDLSGNSTVLQLLSTAKEATDTVYEEVPIHELPVNILLGILLLIVFIALAALLLRFLKAPQTERESILHEVRVTLSETAREPGAKLFDRSPKARIRAAYRKFMQMSAAAGAELKPQNTATEITASAKAVLTDPPGVDALTDLYIRARYSQEEMKPADADQAEKSLKTVKEHVKRI